jgi:hypothetical protein
MINYSNYARTLELRPYTELNEAQVGHASDDSAIGFDKLMGGEKGSPYTSNYNSFVKAIGLAIDKGKKEGVVEVQHDDGSHFLRVRYTIDYTNPNEVIVNLYRSDYKGKAGTQTQTQGKPTPATGQTSQVSPAIKKAANDLWVALHGSRFNEDEEGVYSVFTNGIKSDADLKTLLSYWQSLKIDFVRGLEFKYQESIEKTAAEYAKGAANPQVQSLQVHIQELLRKEEIEKLNSIISKYSTFKFKSA